MAQEDDFPHLTRPDHVSEEAWQTCLTEYHIALARYERAVVATNNQLSHGLSPTKYNQDAERTAHDALLFAREALLYLVRHATGRH